MSKKGFTLIEMMVVVFIIALLAGIIVVSVDNARKNARDAQRVQDVDTINTAIQLYSEANNGNYPPALTGLSSTYIQVVPTDPINDATYYYRYVTNGTDYKIEAMKMESPNGKAKAQADGNSNDAFELYSSGGKSL